MRKQNKTRYKIGYTSTSSGLSSEVELTETENVQESENSTETEVDQEKKEEKPSPSVRPKSKIMYSLIQMSQWKTSKESPFSACQKFATKKVKTTHKTANDR